MSWIFSVMGDVVYNSRVGYLSGHGLGNHVITPSPSSESYVNLTSFLFYRVTKYTIINPHSVINFTFHLVLIRHREFRLLSLSSASFVGISRFLLRRRV